MFSKIKLAIFSLALLIGVATLAGCSKGGPGTEGGPGGPVVPEGAAPSAGPATCSAGSFKLVANPNQLALTPPKRSLYPQYTNHLGDYATTLATLEQSGQVFTLRNSGSIVTLYKNDAAMGPAVDLKSPVMAAKLADLNGLKAIVGTLSDVQVLSVDPNAGTLGAPQVYNQMGGAVSVEVIDQDTFIATIDGDVVKMGSSVTGGNGCGARTYVASTTMDTVLNRPMKAFSLAAADGQLYVATRNYGRQEKTLDSLLTFLTDFFDTHNFLKWKTQVKKINPADGSVTDLPTALENQRTTLVQSLTSTGSRVYASFVSFHDNDVDGLLACFANPASCVAPNPTAFQRLLGFILNANSGALSYKGDTLSGPFYIEPELALPPSSRYAGCPVWGSGCIRIPSLGGFYKNAIGTVNNVIYIRGLFGYARGEAADLADGNLDLQVVTGLDPLFMSPPQPIKIGLGIPYPGQVGRGTGLEFAGFLFRLSGGPGCNPCTHERGNFAGTYPALPNLQGTVLDTELAIPDDVLILGAGHDNAYVYRSHSFKRINLTNPADTTTFNRPTAVAPANPKLAVIPTIRESASGPDRIVALFKDGSDHWLATYESNDPNPKSQVGPFGVGAIYIPPLFPIAYVDDLLIALDDYDSGGGVIKHEISMAKFTWPNLATLAPATGGLINNQNHMGLGIRNVEKVGNRIKVAVMTNTLSPLTLNGVNLIGFDYNTGTNTASGPGNNFTTTAWRGVDVFGEKVYSILENGDLKVYNANTGAEEKTISNVFENDPGQKVMLTSLNARSGEVRASGIIYGNSPVSLRVKTIGVDANASTKTAYPLTPLLFPHVSQSKYLSGLSFGPNIFEGFDLNRPQAQMTAIDTVTGGSTGPGPGAAGGVGPGSTGDSGPGGKGAEGDSCILTPALAPTLINLSWIGLLLSCVTLWFFRRRMK